MRAHILAGKWILFTKICSNVFHLSRHSQVPTETDPDSSLITIVDREGRLALARYAHAYQVLSDIARVPLQNERHENCHEHPASHGDRDFPRGI